MTDEEPQTEEENSSMLYYAIGAVVIAAIIAGVYFLRPKTAMVPANSDVTPVVPTPTPGPITALKCEKQYYNQVIGFPQYYLSVEGADVATAKVANCTFTSVIGGKIEATVSAESPMTGAPERNGNTFRCTTQKVPLTPQTPSVIDIAIKDDVGATTTCSATFIFPK